MLDDNETTTTPDSALESAASAPGTDEPGSAPGTDEPAGAPATKKTAKKAVRKTARKTTTRTAKKAVADPAAEPAAEEQLTLTDAVEPAPAQSATTEPAAAEEGAPAEAEAPAKKAARRAPAKKAAAKKAPAKRTAGKKAAAAETTPETPGQPPGRPPRRPPQRPRSRPRLLSARLAPRRRPARRLPPEETPADDTPAGRAAAASATALLFKAPDPVAPVTRRRRAQAAPVETPADESAGADAGPTETEEAPVAKRQGSRGSRRAPGTGDAGSEDTDGGEDTRGADEARESDEGDDEQGGNRRRRRRGGRRRRKSGGGDGGSDDASDEANGDSSGETGGGNDSAGRDDSSNGSGRQGNGQRSSGQNKADSDDSADEGQGEGNGSRRRRRRRRAGEEGDGGTDDPEKTVTRVRKPRSAEDEITSLSGSTRLEAKKQRRREGREAGRRRAPIVSEAEFLARREAVDRVMVIRQRKDLTQIAVLEDKVLVEHYVARESQTSLIGNVYLGRVQNVLPSMEAAFVDIGKGRNAVLYAGEVNWDALGAGNGPRKIEQVLKSGQPILVQVTKDPIGHKGARLTSQVSLPGRFLVYVPDGTTSGISRKLPDTERTRLKTLLKEIVPDSAGVIVRTAAEGASEEELTHDVERLTARWSDIESKVEKGNAPQLLYGEPDLTLKVVRDLFTEDFAKLVVSGDDAWDMVDGYVEHVAPDLADRLERYSGDDVFADYRIDEQIAKGLDRKVWLPSGGSLIIDRTEAMTVVDVNTGKFTGSGGNLEETVTKNNLEAAEEMVRQLRLRDIGGIIVIDFIDMVLESNRDLVLRRLVECLGRDRTRHQVAEVTSLGLVQMTRKRIGTGLLEAFSETCEHCQGRGLILHHEPVEPSRKQEEEPRRGGRRGRSRGKDEGEAGNGNGASKSSPSPKDIAAMARHEHKPTEGEDAEAGDRTPDRTATPVSGDGSAGAPAGSRPEPEQAPAQAATVSEPEAPSERPVSPPESVPAASERSEEPVEPSTPEEPAAAEPAVPAGPRLVTSSRRRVARRPAGPPSGAAAASVGTSSAPSAADRPAGQNDGQPTSRTTVRAVTTSLTRPPVPTPWRRRRRPRSTPRRPRSPPSTATAPRPCTCRSRRRARASASPPAGADPARRRRFDPLGRHP